MSVYMHALSSISSIDQQESYKGDQRFFGGNKNMIFKGKINENSCSSSSSSIGKNSDISEGSMEKLDETDEVQSCYKGPLSSMDALQEVLPMRRGISRFYNGKSKSFTSLREASTSISSMKDLVKQENGYTRKRRNLLACGLAWDTNKNRGGISKRVTNSSKTTLALAAVMKNCCSSSGSNLSSICENHTNHSNSNTIMSSFARSSPSSRLNPSHCNASPLARGSFSGWRSFSLADLQE